MLAHTLVYKRKLLASKKKCPAVVEPGLKLLWLRITYSFLENFEYQNDTIAVLLDLYTALNLLYLSASPATPCISYAFTAHVLHLALSAVWSKPWEGEGFDFPDLKSQPLKSEVGHCVERKHKYVYTYCAELLWH